MVTLTPMTQMNLNDVMSIPATALPVPVLMVEDDPLMRQRLLRILAGLGYAENSIEVAVSVSTARARIAGAPIGLALVDLGLPDGNGVELIALLRKKAPELCILVVSAWSTEEHILAALRAGATGYVLKDREDMEIALSISSVLRGGAPIDPFIARRILELVPVGAGESGSQQGADAEAVSLSPRETEILHWVAEGLTNREIAEQLFISRHTAECHIKNIYKKLAVSSRTRAVNEARQRGLLP